MTQLPTVIEPGRMTEAEARLVGIHANRIADLRSLAKCSASGGNLSVATGNGTQTVALNTNDTKAVFALLIEREASFLIGFNIALDEQPQ